MIEVSYELESTIDRIKKSEKMKGIRMNRDSLHNRIRAAVNRLSCGNTAHSKNADYIQLAIKSLELWDDILKKLEKKKEIASDWGEYDESVTIGEILLMIEKELEELEK